MEFFMLHLSREISRKKDQPICMTSELVLDPREACCDELLYRVVMGFSNLGLSLPDKNQPAALQSVQMAPWTLCSFCLKFFYDISYAW